MRKTLTGFAALACSLSIITTPALATPAITDPPAPSKTFSAQVEIVDQAGSHVFQVTTSGKTLSKFLTDKGLDISEYRYGDNKSIDGTNVINDKEEEKLYKISSSGSSTLVDLPAPTVEEKTDTLMKGATSTKEPGSPGKMLKTTVVTGLNGSSVKTTSETLLVLEAPKPKVVLVGTKTPEVVVTPKVLVTPKVVAKEKVTQGVVAPKAKDSEKVIANLKDNSNNAALIATLTEQVGKPYVWGAEGPDSFDCSGLVYWVFNQNGVKMPRLGAADYGARAKPVELKDLQPGDIFWNSGHIAIYAGKGKVIHAANPRVGVIITDLSHFTSGNYRIGRLS